MALSFDIEREPHTPIADRLWMCDYERIEDHGDYRTVLQRLERMTGGALGLTEIDDHVDLEAHEAWLQFAHRGSRVRWDFRVDDDWLDPTIFSRYDELLERTGTELRLYSNPTDYGQSALIGAFRREEKAKFDAVAKIALTPIAHQR